MFRRELEIVRRFKMSRTLTAWVYFCNSALSVDRVLNQIRPPHSFVCRYTVLASQDDPALKGTKADPEFVTCLSDVSVVLFVVCSALPCRWLPTGSTCWRGLEIDAWGDGWLPHEGRVYCRAILWAKKCSRKTGRCLYVCMWKRNRGCSIACHWHQQHIKNALRSILPYQKRDAVSTVTCLGRLTIESTGHRGATAR